MRRRKTWRTAQIKSRRRYALTGTSASSCFTLSRPRKGPVCLCVLAAPHNVVCPCVLCACVSVYVAIRPAVDCKKGSSSLLSSVPLSILSLSLSLPLSLPFSLSLPPASGPYQSVPLCCTRLTVDVASSCARCVRSRSPCRRWSSTTWRTTPPRHVTTAGPPCLLTDLRNTW